MAFKENIRKHTYDTRRFQKITLQFRVSQRWHSFFEELDFELGCQWLVDATKIFMYFSSS